MIDKKPQNNGRRQDGGERPPRRRAPLRAKAEPEAPASAFEGERIAKVMARAGACSRRDAEAWIAEGRVSVNGTVLASPAFNVREGDKIEVDGAPLAEREPTRLFLFHKPPGLVTSAKDPEGRETVFGHLEQNHPELPRLVSVGRLDINTEGLLLLTNDGGLARTLELPATGWTRRYRVRAHGEIDQAQLDELKKGVTVDEVDYAPIEARLDRVQGANVWITMALREGKNREIKRVLEHLGLEVNRLIRVSFGPFQLGELAEGAVEEVKLKTLREQLGKGLAELAGVDFSSPRRESAEPEHVIDEERRQRAKTRARKHVTTLRAEREETRGKGSPRARIERSATSDRKGRAVAVETITPTRRPAEERPAATRNARRFLAERQEREEPRAERAPRGRGAVAEREARPERGAPPRRRFDAEGGAARRRPEGEAPRRREGEAPRLAAPRLAGRARDAAPREGRERAETRPRRPRPEGAPPARERGAARGGERPFGRGREERDGFERRPPPREGRGARDGAREERPRRPRPEGEAPAKRSGPRAHPLERGSERPRPRREEREGFEKRERRGPPREGRSGEPRAERPHRARAEGGAPARGRAGPPRGEREGFEKRERRGPPREGRSGETRAERPHRARAEGGAPARGRAGPPRGEREGFEKRERRAPPREGAEGRGPRPPRDGAPRGGKPGGAKPGGGKPGGRPPGKGKPGAGRPSAGPRKPPRGRS
jgi:23S rRNA pseudouridine2605 synthase